MMELHDRLDRLAGPAVPATPSQAEADLARGRRALRRRRTVKGAATGVFAVAAATAALAYGTTSHPASRPDASRPAASPPVASPRTGAVTTTLVAYKGDQPKGYTIDKVPAGWEIQGMDPTVLTIAPVNDKNKDPHVWIGKIAIMLQSKGETARPSGKAMKVGGKAAVLDDVDNLPGKSLYVMQPNGIYLIVQIGDARGWSNEKIVEFAAGIHVLPNAQQGVG
jgi:hypothetical protein